MKNECLFYLTPVTKYIDAVPVGNGRLGAMVCGGVKTEKINLNDDTLWSGFPRANTKDFAYERFTQMIKVFYGEKELEIKLEAEKSVILKEEELNV